MKSIVFLWAIILATAATAMGDAAASGGIHISRITPKVIGSTTSADNSDALVKQLGSCGVEARRVYAQLRSDGRSKSTLIEEIIADGMMPVVSYKVPSVSAMIGGAYDQWMTNAKNYLNRLGVQVTATFWHEPHGDVSPAKFRTASQKFLNRMKATNIAVGPILNGWLMDANVPTFESYTNRALLTEWDFVAVDTYQNGTNAHPGNKLPGRAVPALASWLDSKGFPNKPIGVGEYNGLTASAIQHAGEIFLSTPEVWFALVWSGVANSTGIDWNLAGDKLKAFKATKADTRAKKDAGC